MKLQIRKHGFSGLYVIDEIVTLDGLYITWPGYYDTIKGANKAIQNERHYVQNKFKCNRDNSATIIISPSNERN